MVLSGEVLSRPPSILSSTTSRRRSLRSSISSPISSSSAKSLQCQFLPPSGCSCPPLKKVNEDRPSNWCRSFPQVYARLFDILWNAGLDRRSRAGLFEVKIEASRGPVVLAVLLYERDISLWPDLEPKFLTQCRHYWRHSIPPIRFWVVQEEQGKPPSPPTHGTISAYQIYPSSASIASRKSVSFVDKQVGTSDSSSKQEQAIKEEKVEAKTTRSNKPKPGQSKPAVDIDDDLMRAIAQLDVYGGHFEDGHFGMADD